MYWKHNLNVSPMDVLLAKEDVTLQEIMDTEDILNECKAQNKNLIDFLIRTEIIHELVTLTTQEPSQEFDERIRFKYPNIACELLTCDVPAINEKLASDRVILEKLYSFLEAEPPLNPLMASYFSKIVGTLITKRTEQNWISCQMTCLQVLDFFKAKDSFISLLLKHLGTSAIMDLTLKLMTQVEGVEMRQNILNWLDSQRIIQNLVGLLSPKVEANRHDNVANLLCTFIRIARDAQKSERQDPDPLLNALECSETVSLLLSYILQEKNESAIVSGIKVLLGLLDVYQTSNPALQVGNPFYMSNINDEGNDIEQKQTVIFDTTEAIRTRIADFHNILLDPPKANSIQTTVGLLEPPLGNTRLQITKLFATLLSSNNEDLLKEMMTLGTFQTLLDLFFQYPWNNFLHTQVENCLITALKTFVNEDAVETSNALCKHLLVNCKLIYRILDAWQDNDNMKTAGNGVRQGYMGHLISILNKFVQLCSSTPLGQYFKENLPDEWKNLEEFREGILSKTNSVLETILGGIHPNNSVEDNDDYGDLRFLQSHALQQQAYTEYQTQHLTSQCIDTGFNDDTFSDGHDVLQIIDHRTDNINFDLLKEDGVQQLELIKRVCAQGINPFDDSDDQIFDEKDHTFQTVIEKHGDGVCSSDSDDESPVGDDTMEIDAFSSPKFDDLVEQEDKDSSPLATHDPWSIGDSAGPEGGAPGGWADFSSASFANNFEMPVVEKDLCLEPVENNKEIVEEAKEKPEESNNKKESLLAAGDPGEEVLKEEPSKSSQEGEATTTETGLTETKKTV